MTAILIAWKFGVTISASLLFFKHKKYVQLCLFQLRYITGVCWDEYPNETFIEAFIFLWEKKMKSALNLLV